MPGKITYKGGFLNFKLITGPITLNILTLYHVNVEILFTCWLNFFSMICIEYWKYSSWWGFFGQKWHNYPHNCYILIHYAHYRAPESSNMYWKTILYIQLSHRCSILSSNSIEYLNLFTKTWFLSPKSQKLHENAHSRPRGPALARFS